MLKTATRSPPGEFSSGRNARPIAGRYIEEAGGGLDASHPLGLAALRQDRTAVREVELY
ncbi:MAG TPA: hypothetical protein VGZ73_13025 [Bryobacteraceae bacterium]|nr:hypothetical protein [Bryobacteraceae bacterium]